MKKKIKMLTVAMILTACTLPALAEESDMEFGITADFFSQYIWRGQQLTDGYAFQPGATVTTGGLTAGIWASLDMDNVNGNKGEFTEVDYSLDYSGDLAEGIGYSVGMIYYDFPNTTFNDTTELYWGLSFDMQFSPSITFYHDVDEVKDDIYVSASAGHSFGTIATLGESSEVGMDLGISLGWGNSEYNNGYWGLDDEGLNDLLISLAFPVEFEGGWSFTASVNYSTIVDEDIRSANAGDEDHVFTGLSLAKTF